MVQMIEKMVELLSAAMDGVTVECGYKSDFIKRPVIKPCIFISSDETEIDTANGSFNFIVYVHSPLNYGGSMCLEIAENVCEKLLKIGIPIGNLKMGKISNNGSSGAFEIKISGSTIDSSSFDEGGTVGDFRITAFNFEKNENSELNLNVGKVTVKTDFGPYPIMTICSGKPVGIAFGDPVYELTVDGIGNDNMEILTSNGSFTLRFENEERTVDYLRCFCDSESIGTDFINDTPQLKITSYERKIYSE